MLLSGNPLRGPPESSQLSATVPTASGPRVTSASHPDELSGAVTDRGTVWRGSVLIPTETVQFIFEETCFLNIILIFIK